MQKVLITKVFVSDKKKDGTAFKDKNGKPFWKVAIKTEQTRDDWYSCLCFKADDLAMQLKEGDEKVLVLTEENGFKNFKLPSKFDIMQAQMDELHRRVAKLESGPQKVGTTDIEYPENDINSDDVPF